MKHNRPFFLTLIACTFAALLFSGCQTMEGAGEDIQDAGDAIEDAADDAAN